MTNRLEILKKNAASAVAQYPQYKGAFDNYVLVQIKRDIKTKMGFAFRRGEIAIAEPHLEDGKFRTVWSATTSIGTQLHAKDVELLGGVQ